MYVLIAVDNNGWNFPRKSRTPRSPSVQVLGSKQSDMEEENEIVWRWSVDKGEGGTDAWFRFRRRRCSNRGVEEWRRRWCPLAIDPTKTNNDTYYPYPLRTVEKYPATENRFSTDLSFGEQQDDRFFMHELTSRHLTSSQKKEEKRKGKNRR